MLMLRIVLIVSIFLKIMFNVDGKKLKYADFFAHMETLKNTMKSLNVTFKYMVVEGDKVATIHEVNDIKKDGSHVSIQVNALFQIKDKKIVLCNELTHLISGENLIAI